MVKHFSFFCKPYYFAVFIFLGYFSLYAQSTGYTDTFDDTLKVTAPPSFVLNQQDGFLTVNVHKEFSKTWQSIEYPINEIVNITSHPYMNLKIKSDTAMLLTVHLIDAYYYEFKTNIKIYPSDYFVTYLIDLNDVASLNKEFIKTLKFTANGNSNMEFTAELVFDELKLGDDAVLIAGVGAADKQTVFVNSVSNKINLLDIKNSLGISASSTETSITNIAVSPITNGAAEITFDCADDFTGQASLDVVIKGEQGYADNALKIPINVEGNYPPELDDISDQDALVGDTLTVRLTGISDGNSSVHQPLHITAVSDNQAALPDSNITVVYEDGLTVADLYYTPIKAAQDIQVTVMVNDQYAGNNITQKVFAVNAYAQFNHPPTIDPVSDRFAYLEDGRFSIQLTGISDGDTSAVQQNLTITASSGNQGILPDDSLSVVYQQGSSNAVLSIAPKTIGEAVVTITLEDDGGTPSNNGNAQTQINFLLEVGGKPPYGHTADFTSFDNWGLDYNNGQQDYELGAFKGKDHVMKITLNDKTCWTGTTYSFPELDLSEHRYMCYDIYFEGADFPSTGKTHAYFYDDGRDADEDRNLPAAHAQRKTVSAGEWHTIFLDFRGSNGMDNNAGGVINVKRISLVLLNYASDFVWPFPTDNGTVYIANLKIGDAVPEELIPELQYTCTIDPIADQTIFPGSTEISVELSGITSGTDERTKPTVSAVSSNQNFIPNPAVSAVDEEGKAVLTFQSAPTTGSTTITVTVSASGSINKSVQFDIHVVDSDIDKAVDIRLSPDSLYQTMRGFGTFEFSDRKHYVNLYTEELGATAVRIGIISNQIEPVNDNDDPFVLNMDGFDYSAFDFEYYKMLKDKGVKTFILTSWSPPAWMKRNLSVDYGYASAPKYEDTDNILEPYYYNEFAESMVAVVRMFKEQAGIDLYAIGLQNEPAFTEPYASAVLSPSKFAELCEIVGQRFEQEGIETKLYMPEQVFSQSNYSMSEYIDALKASPQADALVDIIATHSYGEDGIAPGQPSYPGWVSLWNKTQECAVPKELWMSETNPDGRGWDNAMSLAGAIYGALVYGNVSLWTLWDIDGTLLNVSNKLDAFNTAQNYYKYISPGARRIKTESEHEDILAASFIDNGNARLTTVIINKKQEPLTVRILSAAGTDSIPKEYEVYISAENKPFGYEGRIGADQTLALPGNSVATLVGSLDGDKVVSVQKETHLPEGFKLYQNYPNPFNQITTIKYSLPKTSHVELKIYDILGRVVKTLVDSKQSGGVHYITYNAARLASGLYFYRIKTDRYVSVKKMMLLK
jgi:O-glycosyl hydrolase